MRHWCDWRRRRAREILLALSLVALAIVPSASVRAIRPAVLAALEQQPQPSNPDVNDDGIVDAVDLKLVQAALGKRCGQAGFSPATDVNHDCVVNTADTAIVSRALGQTFPSIVATASPPPNANGWN